MIHPLTLHLISAVIHKFTRTYPDCEIVASVPLQGIVTILVRSFDENKYGSIPIGCGRDLVLPGRMTAVGAEALAAGRFFRICSQLPN